MEVPTKPWKVPDLRQRDVRETKITANKTTYYSIDGGAFHQTATQDVTRTDDCVVNENGVLLFHHVPLPHEAVITGAIVYSSEADESWSLYRITIADGTAALVGTADMNVEDITLSNTIVDNTVYAYYLVTSTLDTTDIVWGARVKYVSPS